MPITVKLLLTDDLPIEPVLALAAMASRVSQVKAVEKGLTASEVATAFFVVQKFASKHNVLLAHADVDNPSLAILMATLDEIETLAKPHKARLLRDTIESEVDRFSAKKTDEPGFAVLTAAEKTQIAAKVEFIRQIIENSSLETKKKNALFKKLNRLSAEVMKDGTDTDAIFSFFGELSLSAGQMAKNAKPAIDEAKDILRIILRNRAKRENISLPSPEDILQLPDMADD